MGRKKTMKGGSVPILDDFTKKLDKAKDFNRSKLVQKIEAAIKGQKHDKMFGISIKRTHAGQNWFKGYGDINNALSELRQYFFDDNNTLKSENIISAEEIGINYMNSTQIVRNRKYSMRILLFLFLFLCINTEFRLDQTYSNSVIKTLHAALEHPDDAQRFNLTIKSILIFLHGSNLLYDNDKIKYPLDQTTPQPKNLPDSGTTISMILNGLVMFYNKPEEKKTNSLRRIVSSLKIKVKAAENRGSLETNKANLLSRLAKAKQVTTRNLLSIRPSNSSTSSGVSKQQVLPRRSPPPPRPAPPVTSSAPLQAQAQARIVAAEEVQADALAAEKAAQLKANANANANANAVAKAKAQADALAAEKEKKKAEKAEQAAAALPEGSPTAPVEDVAPEVTVNAARTANSVSPTQANSAPAAPDPNAPVTAAAPDPNAQEAALSTSEQAAGESGPPNQQNKQNQSHPNGGARKLKRRKTHKRISSKTNTRNKKNKKNNNRMSRKNKLSKRNRN